MNFSLDEMNFLHSLKEIAFCISRIKKECKGRKVEGDLDEIEEKLGNLYNLYVNSNGIGIKVTRPEGWFERLWQKIRRKK